MICKKESSLRDYLFGNVNTEEDKDCLNICFTNIIRYYDNFGESVAELLDSNEFI